tara:strand:- start:13840 stop:15042 length:1203 start_codon:yes stop_codon:yes gene_type:complete
MELMLSVLKHRRFRHLFFAQVTALHGTGLATIALSLLAYDIEGKNAAILLGTIFTIKMMAYVFIAPIAASISKIFDRRTYLVALDITRAISAFALIFVTEIWQIYIVIFILQASSAAFTPIYQATIPVILPKEDEYTRALSLSRLAYDLENVISAAIAGLLLIVFSYNILFLGTMLGFLASATLIFSIMLPNFLNIDDQSFLQNISYGIRKFCFISRLRGLFFLNIAIAAGGSMILVNTIVLVRSDLSLNEIAFSITMFAFGLGSMIAALSLPKLLGIFSDKKLMILGCFIMLISFYILGIYIRLFEISWMLLITIWTLSGFGYSFTVTPIGRVLRRTSNGADFSQLYTAQFSLSHACWLFMYPLSGWLMTIYGSVISLISLSSIMLIATVIALYVWTIE